MRILGLDITWRKPATTTPAAAAIVDAAPGDDAAVQKSPPNPDMITRLPSAAAGGWWMTLFSTIKEGFAGAWQRSLVIDRQDVMTFGTVWACVTQIAGDIAKCGLMLVEEVGDICVPVKDGRIQRLLEKPNHYQLRVKFIEQWLISKLTTGNTYVLKERDAAGDVSALYILDPQRVTVLVSPNGSVFYQLAADNLAGLETGATVPAREIIHDVCVPLYHPLVGISPIHACGLAALQGLKIQRNSALFFAQGSAPGGVLTAPASISNEVAKRLEEHWAANYGGESNIGKVVALGDGLKYEPMMMTAVNAQLIEQLKWTGENICGCYHVPLYLVGIGPPPPYTDVQSLNLQYYSQALQNPIETIEALLEDGLELAEGRGIEFDLDALARMDSKTQMLFAKDGVGGGILTINEARARFNLPPVEGGNTPYLQNQMYSVTALAKRDALAPAPPANTPPGLPPAPAPPAPKEIDGGELLVKVMQGLDEAA